MEEQMTCKELVDLVTEYLEGALPDHVRRKMETHLAGCDGCTNYLDQMRQTIRMTGQLAEESLTAEQRDNLMKLFRNWKSV